MVLTVAITPTPVAAHPPALPEHGLDPATFYALWSGDEDRTGSSSNTTANFAYPMQELAASTDIPFNAPPEEVADWNRQDRRDLPSTDGNTSIYPSGVDLKQARFIRDAYVSIFATQPSTWASLSSDEPRQYVAPTGEILGTADYRIAVPRNFSTTDRRVRWRLESHRYNTSTLRVDDRVVAKTGGSRTPQFRYSLSEYPGRTHRLTLAVQINVTLTMHVRQCRGYDENLFCNEWQNYTTHPSTEITVTDSVTVTEYSLNISGQHARYPNGDLGLVVNASAPWRGYSVPGGDVSGVWRFYTARDQAWDTLTVTSPSQSSEIHSPVHPLEVYAYPTSLGATATPRSSVSILETDGERRTAPILPDDINLDVPNESYTTTSSLVTRVHSPADESVGLSAVTGRGLVRGVSADTNADAFEETPIHHSNLSIELETTPDETHTVHISLEDAQTGEPIETATRPGTLTVADQRIDTGPDGTATLAVSQTGNGVSARFEPGPWWRVETGYVADSDAAIVGGTPLSLGRAAVQLFVPVSLFLLAVFLIDRITGWPLWPPWRGL